MVLKLCCTLESRDGGGAFKIFHAQTAASPIKSGALGHTAGTGSHIACALESPGSFKKF